MPFELKCHKSEDCLYLKDGLFFLWPSPDIYEAPSQYTHALQKKKKKRQSVGGWFPPSDCSLCCSRLSLDRCHFKGDWNGKENIVPDNYCLYRSYATTCVWILIVQLKPSGIKAEAFVYRDVYTDIACVCWSTQSYGERFKGLYKSHLHIRPITV